MLHLTNFHCLPFKSRLHAVSYQRRNPLIYAIVAKIVRWASSTDKFWPVDCAMMRSRFLSFIKLSYSDS